MTEIRTHAGLAAALIACCAVASAGNALAQQFPVKPVRIIVPYVPGGGTDTSARLIGRKLADAWGQQVIVENRPGASGLIGSELAARAAPDGYTLMMDVSAHAVNPAVFKKLPFDVERDFARLSLINIAPMVVMVHPSLPVKNARELVALAKARPGQLSFGSSESNTQLGGELFRLMAGIKWEHIAYKGGAAVLLDVAGGHCPVGFSSPQTTTPHYKSGKVRVIGVAGKKPISSMPEVPVIGQSGLAGYEAYIWYGMMAPAATPRDILNRVQQEIARALKQPDVIERLASLGTEPVGNTPDEFEAQVRAEIGKWRKVVKDAGIPQQ